MRKRKAIEKEIFAENCSTLRKQDIMVEVLLDIRQVLMKNKRKQKMVEPIIPSNNLPPKWPWKHIVVEATKQ